MASNEEFKNAILDLMTASRQVGMSQMSWTDTESYRQAVIDEEDQALERVLDLTMEG